MCAPRYVGTISSGCAVQIAQQPQRLQLARFVQPVARLRLQRRRPVPRELVELLPRLRCQVPPPASVPHATHARADAPAGGRDGVIVRAAPAASRNRSAAAGRRPGACGYRRIRASPRAPRHRSRALAPSGGRSTAARADRRRRSRRPRHEHRAVCDDAEFAQRRAAARRREPASVSSCADWRMSIGRALRHDYAARSRIGARSPAWLGELDGGLVSRVHVAQHADARDRKSARVPRTRRLIRCRRPR